MQENGLSKTRSKNNPCGLAIRKGRSRPSFFYSFLMVMTEMSDFLMSGVLGL